MSDESFNPSSIKLQKDKGPVQFDRITAQLNYTFEPVQEQPHQFSSNYTTLLHSAGAEIYTRRIMVGSEWVQIEAGWCANPGSILIENRTGKYLQRNPTEEEKENFKRCVLEISFTQPDIHDEHDPQLYLSCGRFGVYEPVNFGTIYVRSIGPDVNITFAVLPE